jgi:hypothetical protein
MGQGTATEGNIRYTGQRREEDAVGKGYLPKLKRRRKITQERHAQKQSTLISCLFASHFCRRTQQAISAQA